MDPPPGTQEPSDDRTWQDIIAELRRPAPPLPEAARRALEHSKTRSNMSACIHIERMPHRGSLAVAGDSAAAYLLLKLIPNGVGSRPAGVHVALALDVSGSMYEEDGTGASRLKRVQDAALGALGQLRPDDTLAVVAFAHDARLLLPPTPVADQARIEDVIRRIDNFNVDPGGTALDEGLAAALVAVEQHAGGGKLAQVVVLTDGETSGEQRCRELARHAACRKIALSLMGVGLDWKASLLKDLARLSGGKWYYIDVNEAREATRAFAAEFEALAASGFLDVELRLRPLQDVRLKRLRQVVPEIKELKLEDTAEGGLVARLGTLRHDAASRYVLDLGLPARPDGKYAVAQLEVSYDLSSGRRESSGPLPLEMTYTAAGNGPVNAEVMRYIDEIQLKELGDDLERALQSNDRVAAQGLAEEMRRMAEGLGGGAARKTMLAGQAIEELNAAGAVSRRTQLRLGDALRAIEGAE
jgi:Ca-activated chloride channel family protein